MLQLLIKQYQGLQAYELISAYHSFQTIACASQSMSFQKCTHSAGMSMGNRSIITLAAAPGISLLWWCIITTTTSMLKCIRFKWIISTSLISSKAVRPWLHCWPTAGQWFTVTTVNDHLAGPISKSVSVLKKCCPVFCDVTTVANIWATLAVIEEKKISFNDSI